MDNITETLGQVLERQVATYGSQPFIVFPDRNLRLSYAEFNRRVDRLACGLFAIGIRKGDHIGVSAISIAEMIYLGEKGRIPASAVRDLHDATANPKAVLQYVPLDEHVAMKMAEIPRQNLPDLPDRVVAATALFYNVPVLSRDARSRSSDIKTIW